MRSWGTPGISGWGGGNDYNRTTFFAHLETDAYVLCTRSSPA